jgi:hypothetical protein
MVWSKFVDMLVFGSRYVQDDNFFVSFVIRAFRSGLL